ncbi:hypothetical protein R4Z10_09260 [Niallia sp. XMNu-256]|uniref:hypothetical protein n=1 Tax=Niallia sp. XMNu-256 TaxID=3082444 RepID=UPI0030CCCD3A
MEQGQRIRISAHDFIAVLAHSGSVKRAKEFAKESNFSKKQIQQINKTHPETNISDSLGQIVKTVLGASKMIKLENKDQFLLFYPNQQGGGGILEYIHNGHYEFTTCPSFKDLNDVICEFYGLNPTAEEDPVKINIEISNDMYDHLHYMSPADLHEMMNDEKIEIQNRQFLGDFKRNNQQVSKIVFKKRTNERSTMQEDLVLLFVQGEDYIWHLDYEESINDQIFLRSNSVSKYIYVLQKIYNDFFQDETPALKKTSSKPKQEEDRISFKRGLSFFWKSNLALLIVILCFNINSSSWSESAGNLLLLFVLLWEAFIILLSLIACLKRKHGDGSRVSKFPFET